MFTPEGTVGLGGPLLVSESNWRVEAQGRRPRLIFLILVYPMESPGGYQFWGRSLAAWDVSTTPAHQYL